MSTHIVLTNAIAEVQRLKALFSEYGHVHKLSEEVMQDLNLVFEELVSNIIFYGYDEQAQQPRIEVTIACDSEALTIEISDDAKPFNILDAPEPDLTVPFEEREVGGMGIHLIKTLIDELAYARIENRNVVTMRKVLAPIQKSVDSEET